MKPFITYFLLFFFGISFSQTFDIPKKPKFQTSVYDYVNLLSPSQKSSLERKLVKYSDTTSTQIVVGVIGSTNGEDIGILTPKWAHKWGIGDRGKDNGVFILLAKDDRKIWISPGYGVEHILTAGRTGQIIRNVIIPEFKKGDYYSGLDKGTNVIFHLLNGTYQGTRQSDQGFSIEIIIFIIMILLFVYLISRGNNGRGGGRHYRDDSRGLFETIILTSSGRGSFSGGFGSGGFGGGFGGGGFSGGGAGGSW